MYQRILVPLDGSRFGEHALPYALSLASRWGAGVELVTVAGPLGTPQSSRGVVGDESRERGEALATRYLGEAEERIREAGFAGEVGRTVMPAGNVANSLTRHLRESGCDLTVMTTHGRGPVQRAWLGSTADGFIRTSPAPVLLVRPSAEEGEEAATDLGATPELSRRILIPLDGSQSSERLLELSAPFAEDDTSFLLLRAVPPFTAGGSPYLPHLVRDEREHKQVQQAAQEYVEKLAERVEVPAGRVEARVVTAAQPAVAILRAVEEEETTLLAMSTSGRGGVSRLLLGSVADKVVRGCQAPMLLYRKPEEE